MEGRRTGSMGKGENRAIVRSVFQCIEDSFYFGSCGRGTGKSRSRGVIVWNSGFVADVETYQRETSYQ